MAVTYTRAKHYAVFPLESAMNLDATYQANQAMQEMNGDGDAPLVKTTGAP